MLEVARNTLARRLDRFGEGEAVGKAGQAVAQHFGTQGPLGLDFDRTVDDLEQAARTRPLVARQGRQLHSKELRSDAFAVAEVELADGVVPSKNACSSSAIGPPLRHSASFQSSAVQVDRRTVSMNRELCAITREACHRSSAR